MDAVSNALATLALDQKRWSATAGRVRQNIDRARNAVTFLAIGGAIFGTIAAQPTRIRVLVFGYAGAAALAISAIVRQRFLDSRQARSWIIARAASESFKREMFLFRARAGHYSSDDRESIAAQKRDEILVRAEYVQTFVVDIDPASCPIPGPIDLDQYKKERVQKQIEWYRDRARLYGARRDNYARLEVSLLILGALLGAAATVDGKQLFAAWIAVITTILGAIGTQMAAARYDQLTVSYRATADRLESLKLRAEWQN